tara:strand:+ start:368 stop:748 length:381 start_codon:yes stop_codon:yes gene_type:complete
MAHPLKFTGADGKKRDYTRKNELISWDELDVFWNISQYTWDDIKFIYDVFGRGPYQKEKLKDLYDDLDKEKRYKVIKLICKVKGVEYRMDRVKKLDAMVSAEDIELVLKEAKKQEKLVMVENVNVK